MQTPAQNGTKRVSINSELDVIVARLRTREIAREIGFGTIDQARISLAAGELARLLAQATGEQRDIFISGIHKAEQIGIQVLGIHCPGALNGRSNGHSGNGYVHNNAQMKSLVDEYSFEDKGTLGTHITLMKWLS
jgi:serine/threonine-protein kinase RsbT